MRTRTKRQEMASERVMAIGLVWGHMNACQFEEAYRLAKGCLRLWPDDKALTLMLAYAAAEVLEPVDEERLRALKTPDCEEWIELVLRRAAISGQTS